MNFITEKINYDVAHKLFWVKAFYSAEGQEAVLFIGATQKYLAELFKQPVETEFNKGYMNKWLKISMRELTKELPRVATPEAYIKMYGATPEEIKNGREFLTAKK